MSEKNLLENLKNITESKKTLQNEIQTEIRNIFKELDCENNFYAVGFDDNSVLIYLDESHCISTDLFVELNNMFETSGILSYYEENVFISYTW